MELPPSLNPTARQVADRLLAGHPKVGWDVQALEGGHLEASISAPEGSRAGALVVRTDHEGTIWVHFAPAQMWYGVDGEDEMLTVVDLLLRDELLFVRTVDASGAWSGTTLVRHAEDVTLEQRERATVISWSGRRDHV